VLASLLPGLRDLRTPLAVGYLWIVVLWLLLYRWVPTTVGDAPTGPVRALYELGSLLDQAVVLAALSFLAYLLGSMLRLQFLTNLRPVVRSAFDRPERLRWGLGAVFFFFGRYRSWSLRSQLETFVITRLRQSGPQLSIQDHEEILGPYFLDSPDRVDVYRYAIIEDLEAVGIQLQAKKP
jgi:hypothetical protein